MAKHVTQLYVTIRASYRGEEYLPDTDVEEEISISVPARIEGKYLTFPKVMEGAVLNIVELHQEKVKAALYKRQKEEEERKKVKQWNIFDQAEEKAPIEDQPVAVIEEEVEEVELTEDNMPTGEDMDTALGDILDDDPEKDEDEE